MYVHLEDNWNVVHEVDVGEQIQLTCESSSRDIDFYLTGISGKIKNSSEHFFPGSNLIITELSEHYDNYGQRLFHKSLRLTMTAEINNTAVQCGAKEYDTASMRLIWVYSLAVLLRTSAPPYVDIKLIDRGEREADGKVRIECNSSSEHIIFCVVGTPCDSEYSHGLPNGSNPSLSDTLDYYSNESGRTLYTRTLELSVVDLDNIALQCKAGKGVQAFTRTVLFFLTGRPMRHTRPNNNYVSNNASLSRLIS